jgi:hypothetical protein
MWVAGTFNINNSISEITISDKRNMKDWALYLLSQEPGLEWFQNGKLLQNYFFHFISWIRCLTVLG